MRKKYKYIVPIVKGDGVYAPRTPTAYSVIKYYWFYVLIEVTIGGHNYLKNRNYAKEV